MNGWTGNLLRVDVGTGAYAIESSEKYFGYVGGKGMANRIMYDEVPTGTAPDAPENKVVFAVGPNTGAGAPTSGRMTICSLSTFTKYNAIVDAHMGGDTGVMMKTCGYDAVIIEGVSDKPVYVKIFDDKVTIEDASDLWGKSTSDTTNILAEKLGKGVNVVSIGVAGENLINLSCVITGVGHCGGAGVGKVLGSKKVKALAFFGTKGIQVADAAKVMELNSLVMNDIIGSNNNHVVPSVPQSWSEFDAARSRWTGQPGLTWGAAEGGPIDTGESPPGEPTLVGYRCQKAFFDHGAASEGYTVKMSGCAMCPIRCYGGMKMPGLEELTNDKSGESHANTCIANGQFANLIKTYNDVNVEGDGRVYARVYAAMVADDLGLWCNYGDLMASLNYCRANDDEIMKQILTADEYAAIDWTKADTGDLSFIKDILTAICDPTHSLSKLGMGAYFFAMEYPELLGEKYLNSQAMSLWGPLGGKRHHGNECDAQVGQLTNIIHNRDGMCHTIVNITGSGLPYGLQKEICDGIFGEGCLDKPNFYTPMNEAKAVFAKFGVVRQAMHDSMTLCNWVWPMTFSPRKDRGYKGDLSLEAQYMTAVTGQEWTEESLNDACERGIQVYRAMTVLSMGDNDMRNLHDKISEFIFELNPDIAVFAEGTAKLDREDWQLALTMFYKQFGWDEVTGAPTRATLEKFDLKDMADDLEAAGLLPA